MTSSSFRFSLAPLLFVLAACNPSCTTPEAEKPGDTKPVAAESSPAAAGSVGNVAPIPAGDLVTDVKGVDISKLTGPQKTTFHQVINTELSACGKSHSLAVSIRDDKDCRDSLNVAQFVSDGLASGYSAADIKEAIQELILPALKVREINVEGGPVYGNDRAPVTIVVFADFECPHCRAEAPKLRQVVDQYRGRVRLIFKHFPLQIHPRAKVAAIACAAAQKQGKFWEMHDIVFEHQTALEDDDIQTYAQRIGLDMAKFKVDFADPAAKKRVENDRADGEKLEISGTPAVFVNGRYYNDLLFGGTVTGWVEDALRR